MRLLMDLWWVKRKKNTLVDFLYFLNIYNLDTYSCITQYINIPYVSKI
jgi:hypothetical protein